MKHVKSPFGKRLSKVRLANGLPDFWFPTNVILFKKSFDFLIVIFSARNEKLVVISDEYIYLIKLPPSVRGKCLDN